MKSEAAGKIARVRKDADFQSPEVADHFRNYRGAMRANLMRLRRLIFDVASSMPGCEIGESLKWGEPAYRACRPGIGTTIRIDKKKSSETTYAMYFHCRTNLVATFRRMYPGMLSFEGNRAILFELDQALPRKVLKECIRSALTYRGKKA